ncbi:DUF3802 family protein [Shewanella sp. NIFS-20-20]|uniref:DUF3802 family protein n=1 Tax=Shewanella sp. NIFS-20-20 TaxID=2853806 RepID=UPI001C470F66|nr:DUF3802 family protein [Shewanella sp. NIFS-20-20]MBV7314380.1 DUF3802 family protein [Shewanella sp. NIFS-20-20]
MVTEADSYAYLINYLSENLGVFSTPSAEKSAHAVTIMGAFEEQLAVQIIQVCGQNPQLSANDRNQIIKEVDAVMFDLEEVLAAVGQRPVNTQQLEFIHELTGLLKNLFDIAISDMLTKQQQQVS